MDLTGSCQRSYAEYVYIFQQIENEAKSSNLDRYSVDRNGGLHHDRRLRIPYVDRLIEEVFRECHRSRMNNHHGGSKLYRDVKHSFY